MFSHMALVTLFVTLQYLVSLTVGLPLDDRATISSNPWTNRNFSSASFLIPPPSNDWENFAYRIPLTNQILKGRVFTSEPLRRDHVRHAIDDGLMETQALVTRYGPTRRIRPRDNPYGSKVPGCYIGMRSKDGSDGKPTMTWKMMREMFSALEHVLLDQQRTLQASFVLTDEDQVTWGHGQVAENPPSLKLVGGK
ncbi:MAG: hypothetical protein Q9178_002498 [Gyalolechia marmorata]